MIYVITSEDVVEAVISGPPDLDLRVAHAFWVQEMIGEQPTWPYNGVSEEQRPAYREFNDRYTVYKNAERKLKIEDFIAYLTKRGYNTLAFVSEELP